MATFKLRGNSWQAQVARLGVRRSATFPTKQQAEAWASDVENQILSNGLLTTSAEITVADVIKRCVKASRYTKLDPNGYATRLAILEKHINFALVPISKITTNVVAEFRDERLGVVSSGTVRKDLAALGGVFTFAKRELQVIGSNPVHDVSKPKANPSRERRIPFEHEALILSALGYTKGECNNSLQQLAHIFILAIESAMRLGEICKLTRSDIHESHVQLPITKNGSSRAVPLSRRAKETIQALLDYSDSQSLTNRTSASVSSSYWRKIKTLSAMYPELTDLTFHDTRHEATYRLAQKLSVLELARVTGHKDMKMLLAYYNPTVHELAEKLN